MNSKNAMDTLFERRELVRNVHVQARHLQRNIHTSLLTQLRMKFEGICLAEGYIQPQSIAIVENSLGRINLIKGGVDYTVKFQADICYPHTGQVFQSPVTTKSKIGLHIDMLPMKVLLPRDIHIENQEFNNIKEGEKVEFEVVGSRFQQGDETIVVLGKLKHLVPNAAVSAPEEELNAAVQQVQTSTSQVGTQEEKRSVTVDVGVTKPQAVRSKRVRINAASATNEQSTAGETKGTD
jgi:DNA-directed RNA polymerase subunit E'/Rpb7